MVEVLPRVFHKAKAEYERKVTLHCQLTMNASGFTRLRRPRTTRQTTSDELNDIGMNE